MPIVGRRYKDRQNDQRRIVYWLRHHTNKIAKVLKLVDKEK